MYRDARSRLAMFLAGSSLIVSGAGASTIKLNKADLSGAAWINGALFKQSAFTPDSQQILDPILDIAKSPRSKATGFNTTGVLLDDVPTTMIGGILYREFLLDLDMPLHGPRNPSLNTLRISLGGPSTLTNLTTTTPVYSLGSKKSPTHLQLTEKLGSSLGHGELTFDVPDSEFTSVEKSSNLPYVYLDASFSHVRGGTEQFSVVHTTTASDPQNSQDTTSQDAPSTTNQDDPTQDSPVTSNDPGDGDHCGCTCHDEGGDNNNPSTPEPGSALVAIAISGVALLRRR